MKFASPMLLCCIAEQEFFPQSSAITWKEARNHCEVCYKDLVTLTPENIRTIVQNLSSDYWIGLRKSLNTSGPGPAMPWSRWANGDPLTFQNWYPGRPVAKPRAHSIVCGCGGNGVTQFSTVQTVTGSFTDQNVTGSFTDQTATGSFTDQTATGSFTDQTATGSSTDQTATVTPTTLPTTSLSPSDDEDGYVEDACVALLSFGPWVERNCWELLPYICYDDRFYGNISVTDLSSNSVALRWSAGPGNISSYRVEVKGDFNHTVNLSNLTYELVNLMAGSFYSVQVFAIKCERDLNSQTYAFYTMPGNVQNLTVTMVTETSVSMNWSRPVGNVGFYKIEVAGQPDLENCSTTENGTVSGLTPGDLYTFHVITGVTDKSKWAERVSATTYTKPSKVSNLTVSGNQNVSLQLSWEAPKGITTGYRVTALDLNNSTLYNKTVGQVLSVKVTDLPPGTELSLSVTALANGSLEGDPATIVGFTAPGPILSLNLTSTTDSISASWFVPPQGKYELFMVELQLKGSNENRTENSTSTTVHLSDLKTGAEYTLTVYTAKGHLRSQPVVGSTFTMPSQPTMLIITSFNKSHMTLEWTPPRNVLQTAQYVICVRTNFWGHSWNQTVNSSNNFTFDDLKAGTKYDFEVRTKAGELRSDPATVSQHTEAEKREISLSMLCSSQSALHCDTNATRKDVLKQLHEYFNEHLKDFVFWELKTDSRSGAVE
ncbi:receptor-type tyrosine-protein phosphatase H-like [Centroberyx affinis]|uniref:receptor-type tyrosine-protein phosphatase H-like n=1 Tax=Centroberyx affinis TaxID=166261 RepID=UPI003A5C70A0